MTSSTARLALRRSIGEWGRRSAYLSRSEPRFTPATWAASTSTRIFPLPLAAGGWSVVPEGRVARYLLHHQPDPRSDRHATAASPPSATTRSTALTLKRPSISGPRPSSATSLSPAGTASCATSSSLKSTYRFVGGIGAQARNVLLFDTTDIATNTNEAGFSLTQRFYLRPTVPAALRPPRDVMTPDDVPGQAARVGKLANCAEILHRSQLRRRPHLQAGATSSTPRSTLAASPSSPRRATSRLSPRACALRPSTTCASSGTWTTTP